jgi:hypothetical protein
MDIAMERGWQTPSVNYFKPEMFPEMKNKNDKHNGFKERVYEGTPESEISWMQN